MIFWKYLLKKKKEQVITILKERNYSILDNDEEFKYLRSMKIEDVEEENFNKLVKQCDEKMVELELMKKETPNKLWEKELMVLSEKYKNYVITRGLRMGGSIKKKLKGKKKN